MRFRILLVFSKFFLYPSYDSSHSMHLNPFSSASVSIIADVNTDNGAMIAYAGCQRLLGGQDEPLFIAARARWPLGELTRIRGINP